MFLCQKFTKNSKISKKRKKYQNFNSFFENAFTKIGIKKNLKFKAKKLQKYVIFDVKKNQHFFTIFKALEVSFAQ